MNRNIRLFYNGANDLHLPVHYYPDIQYLNISLGKHQYYFIKSHTPLNEGAGVLISKNKFLMNQLLAESGFPVPKAARFDKDTWLKSPVNELIATLKFPLVAKPLQDTGRGTGVMCNIKNETELDNHVRTLFELYPVVQVEEFHKGLREYRVLVLRNEVIGVVERFAAQVTGDGMHSIEELIAIENKERERLSKTLTISPMTYDSEYQHCLEEQGLTLTFIPEKGQQVRLCYTVNTGRGGSIYSHGKQIHPENVAYFYRAAQVAGLYYVGFDVLCEDINKPFSTSKWMLIEANHCPDLTIHEIPHRGQKQPVVHLVLKQLIKRHPFAYSYQLMTKSKWSIFFKGLLMILFLLLFLYLL